MARELSSKSGAKRKILSLYYFGSYFSHFYFHAIASGALLFAAHITSQGALNVLNALGGAVVGALLLFGFEFWPSLHRKLGLQHTWRLIGAPGILALAVGGWILSEGASIAGLLLAGLALALVSPAHRIGLAILRDNTSDLDARIATHSIFGLLGSSFAGLAIPSLTSGTGPTRWFATTLAAGVAVAWMLRSAKRDGCRDQRRPRYSAKGAVDQRPQQIASPFSTLALLLACDATYYAAHGALVGLRLKPEGPWWATLLAIPVLFVHASDSMHQSLRRTLSMIALTIAPLAGALYIIRPAAPLMILALIGILSARVFTLDFVNAELRHDIEKQAALSRLAAPGGVVVGAAIALSTSTNNIGIAGALSALCVCQILGLFLCRHRHVTA